MECQETSIVDCVDTKRRALFTAADGDAETQRISESSHDWYSVVNRLVWSKYVDNSKRRLCLSRRVHRREQNRIYLYALVYLKPKKLIIKG